MIDTAELSVFIEKKCLNGFILKDTSHNVWYIEKVSDKDSEINKIISVIKKAFKNSNYSIVDIKKIIMDDDIINDLVTLTLLIK